MSRAVLAGYYGFDNLGDEAVLAATVAELRRLRPAVGLRVLSAAPDATRRAHGVEAVTRGHPVAVLRALGGCDLFVCGGGSLFQDATSWRSPFYYLGLLAAARRLARRTAVYAQGIERPRRPAVAAAIRTTLDRVDLITVRDRASLDRLADLGVRRPRIALSADPSLLLTPERTPAVEEERRRWGPGPCFGLAVRAWRDPGVLTAIARAARRIAERFGVRWVLLPMQRPADLLAAEAVAGDLGAYGVSPPIPGGRQNVPAALVVHASLGPREMLALTGDLDLLVAMRLHALIFAALREVPLVPIAYDEKVAAFARELGEPAPLGTAGLAPEALEDRIAAAWAGRDAARARLRTAVIPLRERAAVAPAVTAELLPVS